MSLKSDKNNESSQFKKGSVFKKKDKNCFYGFNNSQKSENEEGEDHIKQQRGFEKTLGDPSFTRSNEQSSV